MGRLCRVAVEYWQTEFEARQTPLCSAEIASDGSAAKEKLTVMEEEERSACHRCECMCKLGAMVITNDKKKREET